MSPKVHYPLEQTVSVVITLLSTLVSPTRTRVQPVRQYRDKGAINPTRWPSAQAVASTGGKLHGVGNRCGAELALIPS